MCTIEVFNQLPELRRVQMTATHVMIILAGNLCKKNATGNQHKQAKLSKQDFRNSN